MSEFGPVINSTIRHLHDTIQKQIDATNKQSRIMFWLTCAAFVLAIVQTIATIVQVWLAVR